MIRNLLSGMFRRPGRRQAGNLPKTKSALASVARRGLRLEPLEERALLSVGHGLPPTVVPITASLNSRVVDAGTQILALQFSTSVNDAGSAGNYELREAGADGVLGTGDDRLRTLAASYRDSVVTLCMPSFTPGLYRLIVRDSITSQVGFKLDGNGDGTAGGNWVRDFAVRPSSWLFDGAPSYPVGGNSPLDVAIADMNEDGIPDLVSGITVGPGTDSINILLGDGSGGYHAPQTYSTSYYPASIVVADFNRDGHQDVAAYCTGYVEIMLGDGNGNLANTATIAVDGAADGSQQIAAADFDCDGNLDVAITMGVRDGIGVLRGDGQGNFSGAQYYATGGRYPYAIAVLDVNGDGRPDIATNNVNSSLVSVLLNAGSGFAPVDLYATVPGNATWGLAAGDFNNDGRTDLVAVADGGVGLLTNNGRGGFNPIAVIVGDTSIYNGAAAAADLNHDGNLDLLIASPNGIVTVRQGDGRGSFGAPEAHVAGSFSRAIAVGDLNGDGVPDAAVTNNEDSCLRVLLGDGTGNFATAASYTLTDAQDLSNAVAKDLNGDGRCDLAVITSRGIAVAMSNSQGGFDMNVLGTAGTDLAAGDVNGDGRMDLVAVHRWFNTVKILLGDGRGGFADPTTFAVPTDYIERAVVADVNNDRKVDVVTANRDGSISVLLGDGQGGFAAAIASPSGLANPRQIALADFDGDGNLDAALIGFDSANSTAVVFGDGAGRFAAPMILTPDGSRPESITIGDFNKDGRQDIVVVSYSISSAVLFQNLGSRQFSNPTAFQDWAYPTTSVSGDFNGDGFDDLALNNSPASVSVFLGGQNSPFQSQSIYARRSEIFSWIVAGDFNGDGRLDLASGNAGAFSALTNISAAPSVSSAAFELTDPTSGTYSAGQSVSIEWLAANVKADDKISLCYDEDKIWWNGNEHWIEVDQVAAANGTGSYTWNTAGVRPGTYYVAGYLWSDGRPVFSRLTQPITIEAAPARFSITGPASASYQAGTLLPIQWTASNVLPGSKISLCYDTDTRWNGNEHWIEIDQVTAANGTGTYSWDTTGMPNTGCYIAGYLWDGTSAVFSRQTESVYIVGKVPAFGLIAPKQQTIAAGDTISIEWTAANLTSGGKVSLCYDEDTRWWNGNEHWIEIDQIDANNGNGSYSWNTNELAPGRYYVTGYLWHEGRPIFSHFTHPITVEPARPSIAFTSPTSGAYQLGDTLTIEWTAEHITPGSKISLCYDSDTVFNGNEHWIEVDQVTAADGAGSYDWLIEGVEGGNYYIAGYVWDGGTRYGLAHSTQTVVINQTSFNITGAGNGPVNVGDAVDIQWTVQNAQPGSTISLCYDVDQNWWNGNEHWIEIDQVTAVNGTGSYSWDTSGVAAGTYYIAGYLYGGNRFYPSRSDQPLTLEANTQTLGTPVAELTLATADEAPAQLPTDAVLSDPGELAAIVAAAKNWFGDSGTLLNDLAVEVADLPGMKLADFVDNKIRIDRDAAGYGWFVDPTPEVMEEFNTDAVYLENLPARADGPAINRADVLSAVAYEMASILNLHGASYDTDPTTISPGWRRTYFVVVTLQPGTPTLWWGIEAADLYHEDWPGAVGWDVLLT